MSKKEKEKALILSFNTDKKTFGILEKLIGKTGYNRSVLINRLIKKATVEEILKP